VGAIFLVEPGDGGCCGRGAGAVEEVGQTMEAARLRGTAKGLAMRYDGFREVLEGGDENETWNREATVG